MGGDVDEALNGGEVGEHRYYREHGDQQTGNPALMRRPASAISASTGTNSGVTIKPMPMRITRSVRVRTPTSQSMPRRSARAARS